MKKRAVKRRNRQLLTIMIIAVIFTACLSVTSIVKAGDKESEQIYTYYTSVQIQPGDSLWSISNEYCSSCNLSITAYIDEIKALNGLSDDKLTSGQYLTVKYCSTELK